MSELFQDLGFWGWYFVVAVTCATTYYFILGWFPIFSMLESPGAAKADENTAAALLLVPLIGCLLWPAVFAFCLGWLIRGRAANKIQDAKYRLDKRSPIE